MSEFDRRNPVVKSTTRLMVGVLCVTDAKSRSLQGLLHTERTNDAN